MPAIVQHVSDGVALAEQGRHDRSSQQGNVDLSAVGVSGDRQGDARGYLGKDVRVVRERQDRRIVMHLRERGPDVMARFHEVAYAHEPEGAGAGGNSPGRVFQDGDACRFDGTTNPGAAQPPVVIAQYSPHAARSGESSEDRGRVLGRDETPSEHVLYHIVAGEQNDVGIGVVREPNDAIELVDTFERGTHM